MLGETKCTTFDIGLLLKEIDGLLENRSVQPRSILCINAHIFNLAYTDRSLRDALNASRVVAIDGMSVRWAARLFGHRVGPRCNMTEAFRAFLLDKRFRRSSCTLIGMSNEECQAAARRIGEISQHCSVRGVFSGFLSDQEYEEVLRAAAKDDLILLGMGTPRSEMVSRIAARCCPEAIVWHVGAGSIRILAGTMREAPRVFRRCGLQWLHRLVSDPKVLWRRYLLGNPLFVFRIMKAVVWRPVRSEAIMRR
jgi:exopolysaccharide biosynthesis WecB/TagA/CpsF family protein